MIFMCKPVSEEGRDEVFGTLRHLYILWEDECVLVVHDLPVSSNQGLSIEGSFTCGKGSLVQLWIFRMEMFRMLTAQQHKNEHDVTVGAK